MPAPGSADIRAADHGGGRVRHGSRAALARWAPLGTGLAAGALALGPALGPGYVLRYDMVFVPDAPLTAVTLGGGGGFPRAVPSDAVAALLGRVLPGDLVQALALLAVFAVGAAGAARLVPGPRLAPRIAAALFYVWNPFLAERLLLGQWAVLLGYAGLPWVLRAAVRLRGARDAPRLVVALLPAAVGGFSSVLLSGLVALPAAAARPWRRAVAVAAVVAGCLAVVALPWLVPALSSAAGTDPAAVDLFAARADTPFGVAASLLSLGGVWNAQAVPPGFGDAAGAAGRLLLSLAALAGWGWLLARGPRPDFAAALTAAAAAGFTIALAGSGGPGREVLRAMVGLWPGFGPLRDGQLYVAPLALLQAVGLAGAVLWLVRPDARRGAAAAGRTAAVLVSLAPLVLLPGLAWGAAGTLRPVEYPAEWIRVQRLVNDDPAPGALLSLPWSAYRGFGGADGGGTVVLDPAVKLFGRRVVWNDELRVRDGGEVRVVRGEDPLAREIAPLIGADAAPREDAGLAGRLGALGVRYVLVDHANSPDENRFRLSGHGLETVHSGRFLTLLEVPDKHVEAETSGLTAAAAVGWSVTVGAILWSIAVSGSSLVPMPRTPGGQALRRKESTK
ncbi:hypothetical protein [Actinorugispora endophytica]|uniref:Membrane protein YfhO n=1 Tax=Actinorugispora endophytica TaxID=1605990 RepID=A0A4V3D8K4_9ACTN|nr:hypothetical protein [Actinorugispora endophytica]TDQ51997.1 hypothetical protein EV190_109110 [Actinorugispora endophytica]